jgi:RsiW-degrading membrane proteinase PrsW (M82 family)
MWALLACLGAISTFSAFIILVWYVGSDFYETWPIKWIMFAFLGGFFLMIPRCVEIDKTRYQDWLVRCKADGQTELMCKALWHSSRGTL